jgi:hypothetical protein
MKRFTTVSCRAEGVASVNCENEIGCGKESTLSTMRLGKIGCIAAGFSSAREKIARMPKFILACDITIPA